MKKIVIVFLSVALIAGVGYVVLQKIQDPSSGMESVLPQNISLYVQFNDVEKNLKELESMPVWQGMSTIDYDALIKKNVLDDRQGTLIKLIKSQLSDVMNNPFAKRLLGNDVAIAVYPPEKGIEFLIQEMDILNPKTIEELLSGVFLVTRVNADIQFAEFIARFSSQLGSNVSQGQVEYKGKIIHTIILSDIGVKFGIVRLGNLMVVGIGDRAARISVDVYKKDMPSLAKDSQFMKAQNQFLKPSSMIGYFNFVKLTNVLKNQGSQLVSLGEKATGDADLQVQWEKILAKMNGLKAFTFSSQLIPLLRFDSRLIFNLSELDSEYAPLYTCPSSENKTIHFTPQEVLGYYWSNCFKVEYYWDQIVRELQRTGAPSSRIDDFEVNMGLSIEGDILPAFGEEIGGYVEDIQVGGLFPIPKILFFVEVGDKAKAQGLLQKLEEQPFAMLQEESYNDTLIKYFGMSLGEDIQPGYAFLGNYLLASTSRNLIKDSIDASRKTKKSLKDNSDFKEIDVGLTDKNRNIQFLRLGQIIKKTKGIIGWSNQWMTNRDRKSEAFKAGSTMPLEEVKVTIALKESELEEIRDRLILVEDEIWNAETKGLETSEQQSELIELQKQLDDKKEEVIAENERREGLENIVEDLDSNSLDPDLRLFYIEKVVYPILDSLKSIQSFGLRSTINADALESSMFLKIAQ